LRRARNGGGARFKHSLVNEYELMRNSPCERNSIVVMKLCRIKLCAVSLPKLRCDESRVDESGDSVVPIAPKVRATRKAGFHSPRFPYVRVKKLIQFIGIGLKARAEVCGNHRSVAVFVPKPI